MAEKIMLGSELVAELIAGPPGDKGDPGPGVPAGGSTGQVLVKSSGDDYDTEWVNQSGGVDDAGVAALVGDGESSTGTALDARFVRSEQVRRIVTSTDPDEPVNPGDLLVVLPTPRVVAVAWSEQTYGDSGSITSISAPIPMGVRAGDLLVAMVGSRADVSSEAPAGWSLAATADGPGTSAATNMLRQRSYTRTATGAEGGSLVEFTQASSGRMSLVIVVVRSEAGVLIESAHTASYGASGVGPGPHPIPAVTAPGRGRLAITAGVCALSHASDTATIELPSEWTLITPPSVPPTPEHERLRMWVGYQALSEGKTADGVAQHVGPAGHDGGSITLLLAVS